MSNSLFHLQVGGAFAPPLKDLCRFLKENSEYGVAPEWGDVVKQSVSNFINTNSHIILTIRRHLVRLRKIDTI